MAGQEYLEKLLKIYQSDSDITRPFDINGDIYDAYAAFNVSSAKYVLVKKAELWRADCFEHAFFLCRDHITSEDLMDFQKNIENYIEPHLVRKGEESMPKDHMYTYITGIFVSDQGISKEMKKEISKFRFFKNYRLGIRGYSEARLLVFDRENHQMIGNPASRDLIKGYKKIIKRSPDLL